MAKRTKKTSAASAPTRAPAWGDLSDAKRREITGKMLRAYVRVGRFAAGRYNIVSHKYTQLREQPGIETTGEDGILTATLRNQFIDLARNGVRNNETLNGILNQFEANVVGVEGGKASFDFGDGYEAVEDELRARFAAWAQSAEFFDGLNFNELLRITLKTLLLGGQVALLFDDGVTGADSGRILGYEPDCIANIREDVFAKLFPGYSQHNGRIKDYNRQWCGVIVSHAERGKSEFTDPRDCYFLTRDPNRPVKESGWNLVSLRYRLNQGGGKSPLTAPLGSLIDVQMLQGFEVESAKKNAQTIAQLYQTNAAPDQIDPSLANPAANADTIFDEDTPMEDVEKAVADATAFEEPTVSLDEISSAGCIYSVMPENSKLELLDTKHPNPNMNEFIRLVACRGGWAIGASGMYVTGTVSASFSASRMEQLLTWPTFDAWQAFIEREICDWAFARWADWAEARGDLDGLDLPIGWRELVTWSWPRMREVNAVDEQNAINMGLKNGTKTYSEILGPNWRRKLAQRARERQYMAKLGLPDPANETVSGQIVDTGKGASE